MNDAPVVTAGRLRSLLHYDPATGTFTWKDRPNLRPCDRLRIVGKVAGCYAAQINSIVIRIDSRLYLAHRLAWLYVKDEWPEYEIDHRDLNRANNSFLNLRPAEGWLNRANVRVRSHSRIGVKGVSFSRNGKRYVSQISIHGKKQHLGTFDSVPEAHTAYMTAARKQFGEFANA